VFAKGLNANVPGSKIKQKKGQGPIERRGGGVVEPESQAEGGGPLSRLKKEVFVNTIAWTMKERKGEVSFHIKEFKENRVLGEGGHHRGNG